VLLAQVPFYPQEDNLCGPATLAMVAQAAVLGLNLAAQDSQWGQLVGLGSQIGASALLASYSRDHEREADALGQDYLVRAGYPAQGMTALHQLLVDQEKARPSRCRPCSPPTP
jgi:predicted Zn-dependent protease